MPVKTLNDSWTSLMPGFDYKITGNIIFVRGQINGKINSFVKTLEGCGVSYVPSPETLESLGWEISKDLATAMFRKRL